MNKKILIAAAAVTAAVSLAACGAAKKDVSPAADVSSNNDKSAVDTNISPDANSVQSQTSAAQSEIINSAPIETDTAVPSTDSEITEEVMTETDTEIPTDNADEEPIPEPMSFELGGVTLSAAEIPFSKAVKIKNIDSCDAALSGGTMYILDGKTLKEYSIGDKAEEENTTKLSGAYSKIDTDPYGRLYLSRDRFDSALIDENGRQQQLDTVGKLSMSKIEEYGLCTNNGEITRINDQSESSDQSEDEQDADFPNDVSAVEFSGSHVLIANSSKGSRKITVCDYDGNTIASTDSGTVDKDVTAMTETAGVIAASSCGDLCLWNDSGEFIGRLSTDDTASLLGSDSPVMIKRLFPEGDGSIFCTQSENGGQARLYRISGL